MTVGFDLGKQTFQGNCKSYGFAVGGAGERKERAAYQVAGRSRQQLELFNYVLLMQLVPDD